MIRNWDEMLFVRVSAAVDVRLGRCTVEQSGVAAALTTDRSSTAFIYGAPRCEGASWIVRLYAPHCGGRGSLNVSRSIHER